MRMRLRFIKYGKVVYIEQVREIAEEPNYEAAFAHI